MLSIPCTTSCAAERGRNSPPESPVGPSVFADGPRGLDDSPDPPHLQHLTSPHHRHLHLQRHITAQRHLFPQHHHHRSGVAGGGGAGRNAQRPPHAKQERDSSGRWKPMQAAVPPKDDLADPQQQLLRTSSAAGAAASTAPEAPPMGQPLSQLPHLPASLHQLDSPAAKRQRLSSDGGCTVVLSLPTPHPGAQQPQGHRRRSLTGTDHTDEEAAAVLWEGAGAAEGYTTPSRGDDRRSTLDVETAVDHINDGYRCIAHHALASISHHSPLTDCNITLHIFATVCVTG